MVNVIVNGKSKYNLDNNCQIYYGYFDLQDLVNSLSILDSSGYLRIRRMLAWNLYFHLSRNYSDQLRNLYYVIYEISAIIRELNFRNINPAYALPSILNNINTSMKLSWKNGEFSLKDPLEISCEIDLNAEINKLIKLEVEGKGKISVRENEIKSSNEMDLYKLSDVKGLSLESEFFYRDGKVNVKIDLKFKPENRGLNKEINAEDLNKVLRITAKEVNEKAINSHEFFEDFMVGIMETLIQPFLEKYKNELAEVLGFKEILYIPAGRHFILNAEESALNNEEITQLFSDSCQLAINRIKEGKSSFFDSFSLPISVKGGLVFYEDSQITSLASRSIKSLATIILEVNSLKDQALIIMESPEEFLLDEDKSRIVNILEKLMGKGNKVIIHTWDKKFLEYFKECNVYKNEKLV
ncbi:hypothetical protein [Acidianus ambivalens]|uniref:Uncharacterized protein n=1 Tax=Acidianus ambivalens TaxID=2283 RepID=A0A650CY63_ACIAM|nr:hypothetical protein [Acidianus ambivalens]MQL54999.1 hypothetical protein [Acidianus ambivalens]QGR22780.1 hypothetical protein D1866_12920 [Acidianus ambivalens]